MAIEDAREIQSIVKNLETRGVLLYHACQLKDFRSYVKLGGVPSRNKLQSSNLDFTAFDTDRIDRGNQVWNKVFGNFSDFGREFTKEGSRSQPNPYGPIQIAFNPCALNSAADLSITLRSAGARDFDRNVECLQDSRQLDAIFQYQDIKHAQHEAQRKNIAFSNELNARFNRKNCTSPEFNCTIANELLSFDNAAYIIVDSCIYQGSHLLATIQRTTNIKSFARNYYHPSKKSIIEELSSHSANYDCTKQSLIEGTFASDHLKRWVNDCNEFYYNRFIRYLTDGTTRA
ncbi:hypothetical protein V0R51_16460 [Pseudomonas otitidis]|uniref:hypothetical protein n=1 Tax=Metapseudomonas otitidis TaxID=319939 RepID=UPI002E7B971B|nr:hypothetical protein [Pseudomonas otitidis]MEE1894507.1 hypothetical protein [Pseudomonas otitidis]